MAWELGYWKIRGLAAPARMMFAYKGVEFVDHQYEVTLERDGTHSKKSWFEHAKPRLITENPLLNLPYVRTPSGRIITQSNAVYRAIARGIGLAAQNEIEEEAIDQLLDQVMDMRNMATRHFYGGAVPDEEYLSMALQHFAKFENWFRARGTQFSAADSVRVSDFHLFEMLDQHAKIFGPEKIGFPDGFPLL